MDDNARETLARLCIARGESLAALSRMLGRNEAYIQQYLKKGTPRRLPERERRMLARHFSVSEAELGGPAQMLSQSDGLVALNRSAARASAGPGRMVEGEVRLKPHLAFDRAFLRGLTGTPPERLSIVQVEGESMAPTFRGGDDLLVDHDDDERRLRDGVYVLRADDLLVVKRLAINPFARMLTVQSDNPDFPDWPDRDPAELHIVGRVLWAGRRIA